MYCCCHVSYAVDVYILPLSDVAVYTCSAVSEMDVGVSDVAVHTHCVTEGVSDVAVHTHTHILCY